jgi:CRP-like cAMP-binding protein
MDKAAAIKLMNSAGWLSRQPETFRHEVLSRTIYRNYKAGESLFDFEDEPSGVFGLVEGVIEIQLPNGHIATMGTPGYWVGEGAAFRREPRRVSILSKTDVHILYLPLSQFDQIIANAAYCRIFATLTVYHLDVALTVISDLMVKDAVARVCSRLLTLAAIESRGRDQMLITQEDLASMTGVTRQTVNKAVGRLIQNGIVSKQYGRLVILDMPRLRGLAASVDERDW